MGRGGGGGGPSGSSRSSGGGGNSRAFGGSSSGSSSHRGGYKQGPSPGNSHGHRPPPPPPGPPRHRHGPVHVHNYYGGSPGYRPARRSSIIVDIAVVLIMLAVCVSILNGGRSAPAGQAGGISSSTVERTALKPYGAFQKGCWEDRAGWLSDSRTLDAGMEAFYKETGIQPALVITEDIDGAKGPSSSDVEDFAGYWYDQLIGHERGILLLFCEWHPSDYDVYYMAGEDAQTVMDSEACDILMDYVHAYYASDLTEDGYFAAVFRETGERIMSVTPTVASRLPMVLGVIAVGVVAIAVIKLVSMRYRREKERAEEMERILNTPNERL